MPSTVVVIFVFCMWRPLDGWFQLAYLGLFPVPIARANIAKIILY
jgi:hypothetical protein